MWSEKDNSTYFKKDKRKIKNNKLKEFIQFQKKWLNMAYPNLRHGTERKGRSVILEREIINLQSKNPCRTPLYGRMRGMSDNSPPGQLAPDD